MSISTSNFFKEWASTICSLRKFTSAYYTKFQEKLCNSLLMINMKKNITEKEEEKQNFESIWMPFLICTCVTTLHSYYNLALVLHENALNFNQSGHLIFSCKLLLLKYSLEWHKYLTFLACDETWNLSLCAFFLYNLPEKSVLCKLKWLYYLFSFDNSSYGCESFLLITGLLQD